MVAGIELDAFRVECLRPVTPFVGLGEVAGTPFYEAYGERLVQAGHYREVIRCREHVAPILDGLRQWRDHAPA